MSYQDLCEELTIVANDLQAQHNATENEMIGALEVAKGSFLWLKFFDGMNALFNIGEPDPEVLCSIGDRMNVLRKRISDRQGVKDDQDNN